MSWCHSDRKIKMEVYELTINQYNEYNGHAMPDSSKKLLSLVN